MDVSSSSSALFTVPSSSTTSTATGLTSTTRPHGYYIAHAQHPTIITHSLTCSFTSPTDTNLILARLSRLDVMRVTATGLTPVLEIPLNGRIASLSTYLPRNQNQHRLIVTTDNAQLFILTYNQTTAHVSTLYVTNLQRKVGSPSEAGHRCIVTPSLILLSIYEGIITAVPIDAKGALSSEAVDIHIDDVRLIDCCMLSSSSHAKPTLAILSIDARERRYIRTYTIDVKDRQANPAPLAVSSLDHSPAHLLAVDDGGVLVVGEESVVLYGRDGKSVASVRMTPSTIVSTCRIDATRYLLADITGDLTMLLVQTVTSSTASSVSLSASPSSSSSPSSATQLQLLHLGSTTIASTMSYLTNGYIFLGSTLGDHQLIQLHTQPIPTDTTDDTTQPTYITTADTFPNLGAIVDMTLQQTDEYGGGQLITASGAWQCGSLRIVRSGVGVEEEASIELEGIQGLWGIKETDNAVEDKYLIQSFVGETRVLAMEGEELGEIEMDGLDSSIQTKWCGNMNNNVFAQISERSIRLIDGSTMALRHEWTEGSKITVASGNRRQILVCQGNVVVLLAWDGQQLVEEKRVTLNHEVACADITPIATTADTAQYAVLGMWTDRSIRILQLPSLTEVARDEVGSEVIPRSVLLCPFTPTATFLLVGLGDGHLISYSFSVTNGTLSNRKSLVLGSQPLSLSPFRGSNKSLHVFAGCDRPTIVYCVQDKLLYSAVNLRDIHHMTSFATPAFPTSLAFASPTHLLLGPIDAVTKLHIQSIPLQAQPRRVVWFGGCGVVIVIVSRFVRDERARERVGVRWREVSEVICLDDTTYERTSSIELKEKEAGSALFITRDGLLGSGSEPLLVVGTAVVEAGEVAVKEGRLLLMRVVDKRLELVSETRTKGAVMCIEQVKGRVVCGINSRVVVYRMLPPSASQPLRLLAECSIPNGTIVMALATWQDYVVAADLQQSVSYLVYVPASDTGTVPTIEKVARDWDPAWITALSPLHTPPSTTATTDTTPPLFLAADHHYNLFTLARNTTAATEEERTRVDVIGRYHVGDMINVLRTGCLTTQPDIAARTGGSGGGGGLEIGRWGHMQATALFGTIGGGVGVLAPLGKEEYAWLSELEAAVEGVMGSVGGLEHRGWRGWKGERGRRDATSVGFVDGDLVEMTLELRTEQQQQLSSKLKMPWAEITRRVEEMSRIH